MAYPFDDDDNLDIQELGNDMYGEQLANSQTAEPELNNVEAESTPMVMPPVPPKAKSEEAPAPMQSQAPAIPEPKNKTEELLNEYKKLQDESRHDYRNLAIVDALSQAGQAIAARNTPNYKIKSNMDMFEKMANRPVEDYSNRIKQRGLDLQLQDEERLRDPNSSMAKQLREAAQKRGYQVDPNATTQDIGTLSKFYDPLKDTLTGQKIEEGKVKASDTTGDRNADSARSRAARQYAQEKLNITFSDDMTYHDIADFLKNIKGKQSATERFQFQSIYDPDTKQTTVYKASTATGEMTPTNLIKGFAPKSDLNTRTGEKETFIPGLGKTAGAVSTAPSPVEPPKNNEPAPLTRDNLNVNQQKSLDDTRKAFMDDSKDDRSAAQSAEAITELLDAGKALDGDILRAVQTKFARASGEKGAMTELDVSPYGGRQAILDRINRSAQMWVQGKIPDSDRQFLTSLANTMKQRSEENVKERGKYYVDTTYQDLKSAPHLKDQNFDKNSVSNLLGISSATTPTVEKIPVISKKTHKTLLMPKDKVDEARQKGLIE